MRNINQKCFDFQSLLLELAPTYPNLESREQSQLPLKPFSTPDLPMTLSSEVTRSLATKHGLMLLPSLTNSWSLYVGYSGITLLLQTQTILPQLMFWSTICRLKSLNYMARQIKADHRVWSAQVGCDSSIRTSQKSCCFPSKPRGITPLCFCPCIQT